jgi:hypothetical protein
MRILLLLLIFSSQLKSQQNLDGDVTAILNNARKKIMAVASPGCEATAGFIGKRES